MSCLTMRVWLRPSNPWSEVNARPYIAARNSRAFKTVMKFKFCHYELSHSMASAIRCNHKDKLGPTPPHYECFSPGREKSRLPLAIYCKRSVCILGAKLCRAYRQDDCRLQAERDVPLKCLQRPKGVSRTINDLSTYTNHARAQINTGFELEKRDQDP